MKMMGCAFSLNFLVDYITCIPNDKPTQIETGKTIRNAAFNGAFAFRVRSLSKRVLI